MTKKIDIIEEEIEMNMKDTVYVIKCPYCGGTYTMEQKNGEGFVCPNCGASNSMQDVVERIEPQSQYQQRQYRQVDPERIAAQRRNVKIALIVCLSPFIAFALITVMAGIAGVIIALSGHEVGSSTKSATTSQQKTWRDEKEVQRVYDNMELFLQGVVYRNMDEVRSALYLPEGSMVTDAEIEKILQGISMDVYEGETGSEITKMTYDNMDGENKIYSIYIDDSYFGKLGFHLDDAEQQWKVRINRSLQYNTQIWTMQDATLYVDGEALTMEPTTVKNEQGVIFDCYTVPVMYVREYQLSVETGLGTFDQTVALEHENDSIIQMKEESIQNYFQQREMNELTRIWNAVKECSLQNQDIATIRSYFTDAVTDQELEKLCEDVRYYLGEEGEFNNASLEELRLNPGSSIIPVSEDVYLLDVTGIAHGDQRYFYHCDILVEYKDGTIRLQSVLDNRFFAVKSYNYVG